MIDRWNVADALHSPKGMRRHSNRPSSHANAVSLRSRVFSGICQKAHAKSMRLLRSQFLRGSHLFWAMETRPSLLHRLAGGSHSKSKARMTSFFYHNYPTSPQRVGRSYRTEGQKVSYFLIGFRCFVKGHSSSSFSVWHSLRL